MDETLKRLTSFFAERMHLSDEEQVSLEEMLEDFVREKAREMASDALDHEFNRGAYR